MHVNLEKLNPTRFKLTIVADDKMLTNVKINVLKHLGKNHIKLQGFRPGKAPLDLIEKNVDHSILQSEFLDKAVNDLYVSAIEKQRLRPVAPPDVNITKFVPFTTLEFMAEVEAVGDIKIPDLKLIKISHDKPTITEKEINEVIDNLKTRAATRKEVSRSAKAGDEVLIDFSGIDAETKEPIKGADGKDYPLVLGSDTFIPGFESHLIGLKTNDKKEFTLTFPDNYGLKALQSRKVKFSVIVKKVQQIVDAKLDSDFAATIGPFKSMEELKEDIKKQLITEKQTQLERDYESKILEEIAKKSLIALPPSLVDEEIERIEQEERQNVIYRGQTWQEHLDEEGVSSEEHKERNRPGAEMRVKAGLILGEIAESENIRVTPEELEIRLQLLKGQYGDASMQAELEKPENVRDIASRMLTEKTLIKIKNLVSQ